jgi:4-hydroxy-tetrahydrodipicolinate reductase
MDLLSTILSGLCQNVKKVEVWKVQDASVRRVPFQQKIGAALTLGEFEARRRKSSLRHVALPESVDFIAERLGWKLDRNEETLEPVIAETQIDAGYKPISKGVVRGVHQVGRGIVGDNEFITLNFRAAVGEPESYDQVRIDGDPVIESRIAGGVNGNITTCTIALNTIRPALDASPGLKTMAQIPPIGFSK